MASLFQKGFFLSFGFCTAISALPQNLSVSHGEAHLNLKSSTDLQIEVGEKAILQWESFSLEPGEKLHFLQPSPTAAVLNEITGEEPSYLLGTLSASGQVYLINPQGIIFGKECVIDTSSFLASTFPVDHPAFLEGAPLIFTGESNAEILHLGNVRAREGDVIFLARKIVHQGSIEAPKGNTILAAGYEVMVKPKGDSLIHIRPRLEKFQKKAEILSEGTIQALKVQIQTEDSAYSLAIHKKPDALDLVWQEEELYLKSSQIEVKGEIQAEKISLRGDEIFLQEKAKLIAQKQGVEIEANFLFNQAGKIHVEKGNIEVKTLKEEGKFYQLGEIYLLAAEESKIKYQADSLYHAGKTGIDQEEGRGSIFIEARSYIDTKDSWITVNGKKAGSIVIEGGPKGSLFSSGTLQAIGEIGGEILLQAGKIQLAGACIDTRGSFEGGKIFLGAKTVSESLCSYLFCNWATQLRADAQQEGKGGGIFLFSSGFLNNAAEISAKGGEKGGEGGLVELSALSEFQQVGLIQVESTEEGKHGKIVFDPKNIIISKDQPQRYPQFEIFEPEPIVGGEFGGEIYPLNEGKVVITRSKIGEGVIYLFNGFTGQLLGATFGKGAGASSNRIGIGGIKLLSTGDYVVCSPEWFYARGAATLIDGKTGHPKLGYGCFVNPKNSLCGKHSITTIPDQISSGGVVEIQEGKFVVISPNWTEDTQRTQLGAVTWFEADGSDLLSQKHCLQVSRENSIHGTSCQDRVGSGGVYVLSEGNFVVASPEWNYREQKQVGAITLIRGNIGKDLEGKLRVSEENSLCGRQEKDHIGLGGVFPLASGNYVVVSPDWNYRDQKQVGAVTFVDFQEPIGFVSTKNSLHGTKSFDRVGSGGVFLLSNGNYVVNSPHWNLEEKVLQVGAVTLLQGSSGKDFFYKKRGVSVSLENSLHGTYTEDQIGSDGIFPLQNGDYAVASGNCRVGSIQKAGALTFIQGDSGKSWIIEAGPGLAVEEKNSLHGIYEKDQIGKTISTQPPFVELAQGNLACSFPYWKEGRGAVVLLEGATKKILSEKGREDGFAIREENTFHGTQKKEYIGSSLLALPNGNVVSLQPHWSQDRGAATILDSKTGKSLHKGLSFACESNSFVGNKRGDQTGVKGYVLSHGHFLVVSPYLDFEGAKGGVTLLDKNTGYAVKGGGNHPSIENSLLGIHIERFSEAEPNVLAFEDHIFLSPPSLPFQSTSKVSIFTWADTFQGVSGVVGESNSIFVKEESYLKKDAIVIRDDYSGSFILGFPSEHLSEGRVRIGIMDPNRLTFAQGAEKTLCISPQFLEEILKVGAKISLQANNDISLLCPLNFSSLHRHKGELTLQAGRHIHIGATIQMGPHDLRLIANDYLVSGVIDPERDPGAAKISVHPQTFIASEGGSLSLELVSGTGKTFAESGNLWLGEGASLMTKKGFIHLFAEKNTITLKEGSKLISQDGDILVKGGMHIEAMEDAEIQTTGKGSITLVVDHMYPNFPEKGGGKADILQLQMQSKGIVHIYASQKALNAFPKIINGAVYDPSCHHSNKGYEQWGTYYPEGRGSYPFTIFFKESFPSSEVFVFSTPENTQGALPALFQRFFCIDSYLAESFLKWKKEENKLIVGEKEIKKPSLKVRLEKP